MEQSVLVVSACLLGALLLADLPFTMSTASSQRPTLTSCVFIERVNVTCWWKPLETPNTSYTLKIWNEGSKTPQTSLLTCSTIGTNCTVNFTGLTSRANFCINVTAHNRTHNVSSLPRCQRGRNEVKLSQAVLQAVKPVQGRPQCLKVTWRKRSEASFPVSGEEIKAGQLNSQIEFRAQGELNVRVKNVTVTGLKLFVCGFRPDSEYHVRLRHRYLSETSPWSEWSEPSLGRTGEAAPSAAPVFWRQVMETPSSGRRFVSLLWKPLSQFLANGRIIFYNMTCQTEKSQSISLEACRHLGNTSLSCSLHLPADRCSCTLSASTSAGTSPGASLWFPGAAEIAPSGLEHVSVRLLNDSGMEVGWAAPGNPAVSGFVVEWEAVREKSKTTLHWEKLNATRTTLIITEGLKPMERYAVSVRVLYGDQQTVGEKITRFIYTREGAPSVGPDVIANKISGSTVELSWTPVPVEQLHGFLHNYTLYITTPDQQPQKVILPSDSDHYTLENLSPGTHRFSMAANTYGGSGPVGTEANVHIAFQESSTVVYIVLPLILTLVMVSLLACMTQTKTIKLIMCTDIPDPSNSTLSHWSPKTMESLKQVMVPERPETRSSEVILYCESKAFDSNEDQSYQSTPHVQIHSSLLNSPQLVRVSEDTMFGNTDPSIHPSFFSNILFSPTYQNLAAPLESSSYNPFSHVAVRDFSLLPGGATASSDLSPTDEHKPFCLSPKQLQSRCFLSDFDCSPHSSLLVSEPAEVCLFQHPNNFEEPFPPFSNSIFVDLSYCPLECDPYIPSDP